MNVKVVCTTDDPTDSLEHHQELKNDGFEIKILPAYRPDKAMNVDDPVILMSTFQNLRQQAISAFLLLIISLMH